MIRGADLTGRTAGSPSLASGSEIPKVSRPVGTRMERELWGPPRHARRRISATSVANISL